MKILITGGSGLVGKNFLDLQDGPLAEYSIHAPSSNVLNLLDYDCTYNYLVNLLPDLIIHAAGMVGGIHANIDSPVDFLSSNLRMGENLIRAAKNVGIPRLINLGSSCMYPANIDGLISEESLLTGKLESTNEGYALAKLVCLKLCSYISLDSNFEYKTIVPCNLYGKYDKFDPSKSHLIPAIIQKLSHAVTNSLDQVSIWGDGTARREFLYAGDFACLLTRCITNFSTLPGIMNVGLGRDYSIFDYYNECARVIGYEGDFTFDLTKPVGMRRKVVSIDRQLAWGWQANTSLTKGIIKTYDYFTQLC